MASYTDEEVKVLINLYQSNTPISEIAHIMHKSPRSVSAKLTHLRIAEPKQNLIDRIEAHIPCKSPTNLKYTTREVLDKICNILFPSMNT